MTFQYKRTVGNVVALDFILRFTFPARAINSEARTQSLEAQKICQCMIVGYKLIALRRNIVLQSYSKHFCKAFLICHCI